MIQVCRQPSLCELYTAVTWRRRLTKSPIYHNNVDNWIALATHMTLTRLPLTRSCKSSDDKIINESAIIHGKKQMPVSLILSNPHNIQHQMLSIAVAAGCYKLTFGGKCRENVVCVWFT